MRPYHPNNLDLQPFPAWKVIVLAWAAKLLRVQFKINGIPYGASHDPSIWPAVDCGPGQAG